MRFGPAQEPEDDSKEWLVTYADMVTLILTFFVLMLAISSLDKKRFEEALGSIKVAMGAGQSVISQQVQSPPSPPTPPSERAKTLTKELNHLAEQLPGGANLNAKFDQGRILVTLGDRALFSSGEAELLAEGQETFLRVSKLLKIYSDFEINIRGHTDSRPIKTERYPSNWELSAIRATTVLRFLLAQGLPARRLTATGLADLEPLAPNDSEANMALNRRVELVLEQKK